ncbi:MAG: hypothetical protein L0219_00400 [Phycisphaerales bacterium]|nr:hypothetical protein [Phycisphaerales bacterium]
MRPICARSIVFAVCVWISMPAFGAILYVDDSATRGLNDGTSWENAFLDLQSALAIAKKGDKIHIGAGTYEPSSTGDRTATFKLPKRVVVRGGFGGVGAEDPDAWDPVAHVTKLSGDLNNDDTPAGQNIEENSFHVVTATAVDRRAKLRGLTVTGGNASEVLSSPAHNGSGGGLILNNNASPTIVECTFASNKAIHAGGAVLAGAGSPVFKGCKFQKNKVGMPTPSAGTGGAVAGGAEFHNCMFEGNQASVGSGAVAGPAIFYSCTFEGNTAEGAGAIGGSELAVDCTFIGNIATYSGGAAKGAKKLINCKFYSNSAGQASAGAVDGVELAVNCLFSGNSAELFSNAATVPENLPGKFVNCTFVGNQTHPGPTDAAAVGVMGAAEFSNCIFWNNGSVGTATESLQVVGAPSASLSLTNCCVMGWTGALGGSGNSGDDPLFIDADGPDDVYGTEDDNPRLSGISTCIDAGQNVLLPKDKFDLDADENVQERTSLDLDLAARRVNGTVDIGAFESPEGGYPPVIPDDDALSCPADIAPASEPPASAGDGSVDENDLLAMIGVWGACDGCVADLSGNGAVNVEDLLLLVAAWGECP